MGYATSHLVHDQNWLVSRARGRGGEKGTPKRFLPEKIVRTTREQDNMGYRRVGLDETRLSVYADCLLRG